MPPADQPAPSPVDELGEEPSAALIAEAAERYRASDEVRDGLLGLILRQVDEGRFGRRDLSPEELSDLARAWSLLNDGLTSPEVRIDWSIKRRAADRADPLAGG